MRIFLLSCVAVLANLGAGAMRKAKNNRGRNAEKYCHLL